MIRILLVDDHPVVRHGIRQILVDGLKNVSVGEASDVRGARASIKGDGWDLVVLDVTLPGESGLDLLKDISVVIRACRCSSSACIRPRSSRGARSPPARSAT